MNSFLDKKMEKMNITISYIRKKQKMKLTLFTIIFFLISCITGISIFLTEYVGDIKLLSIFVIATSSFITMLFFVLFNACLKYYHPGLLLYRPSFVKKIAKKNNLNKDFTSLNSIDIDDIKKYELFLMNNLTKHIANSLDWNLTIKLYIMPLALLLYILTINSEDIFSLIILFISLGLVILLIMYCIAYAINHRKSIGHSKIEYKINELYECGAINGRDYMIYLKFIKKSNS